MWFGPDFIYQCPVCNGLCYDVNTLSGNDGGKKIYSDTKVETPMLLHLLPITICKVCGTYLWLYKMKPVSTDKWDKKHPETDLKKANVVTELKLEDYCLIIKDKLFKNKNDELFIRKQLLFKFNDRIRLHKPQFISQEEIPIWKENINRLMILLDKEDMDHKILLAELYRYEGNFEESLQIISSINDPDYYWVKKTFEEQIQKRNLLVFQLLHYTKKTSLFNQAFLLINSEETLDETIDYENLMRLDPLYYNKYIFNYIAKNNDDYHKAIRLLDEYIAENPSNDLAFFSRAVAHSKLRNFKVAFNDCNSALKHHPSSAQYHNCLGAIILQRKNFIGAFEEFNKALELDPAFISAYSNRASIHDHYGRFQEANEDFTKALECNPTDLRILSFRSNLRKNYLDSSGAISDLTVAINIAPNSPKYYFDRGTIFLHKKHFLEALDDFSIAIKLDPNYYQAYFSRGKALIGKKDFKNAVEDFSFLIKTDPEYTFAYIARGSAREILNDFQGALEDYNQALTLNPNYGSYAVKVEAMKKKLHPDYDVLAGYSRIIRKDPYCSDAYLHRGREKMNRGDYKGAVKDFTKDIQLYIPDSIYYFERSTAYFHLGEQAKSDLDKFIFEHRKLEERAWENKTPVEDLLDHPNRILNLPGSNLKGIVLNNADLPGANFENANMEQCHLDGVNFNHSNLKGANLKNASLHDMSFRNSNLKNADFSNTSLYEINLSECDLTGVNFTNAHFYEVNLTNTKIRGANFTGVQINEEDTDLMKAIGPRNLKKVCIISHEPLPFIDINITFNSTHQKTYPDDLTTKEIDELKPTQTQTTVQIATTQLSDGTNYKLTIESNGVRSLEVTNFYDLTTDRLQKIRKSKNKKYLGTFTEDIQGNHLPYYGLTIYLKSDGSVRKLVLEKNEYGEVVEYY